MLLSVSSAETKGASALWRVRWEVETEKEKGGEEGGKERRQGAE